MKKIPLTGVGIIGAVALIDDEDWDRISKYKWRISKAGYAYRNGKIDGKMKYILMHRYTLNALPGITVDHINFNRLDNRKANLRNISVLDNSRIKRPKGKYTGVYFDPEHKKFRVHIKAAGRHIFIGSFDNEIEAAEARDRAVIYFDGKGKLNFPDKIDKYRENPHIPNQAIPRSGKYIGICWHSRRFKWSAYISVNEEKKHLGYFEYAEDAARAYDKAAKQYRGVDTKVNFPDTL